MRKDRERLMELKERSHILRFKHPVGALFTFKKKHGYGIHATMRTERWRLIRYSPNGPVFQFVRKDGTLGDRIGAECDVPRTSTVERPAGNACENCGGKGGSTNKETMEHNTCDVCEGTGWIREGDAS